MENGRCAGISHWYEYSTLLSPKQFAMALGETVHIHTDNTWVKANQKAGSSFEKNRTTIENMHFALSQEGSDLCSPLQNISLAVHEQSDLSNALPLR